MAQVQPLERGRQLRRVGFAEDGRVAVRDTEMDGRGPLLVFTASEWEAFVGGARQGEFDSL